MKQPGRSKKKGKVPTFEAFYLKSTFIRFTSIRTNSHMTNPPLTHKNNIPFNCSNEIRREDKSRPKREIIIEENKFDDLNI
uniref:CSON010668 protein n=1 Tax=Culicoides sonorensis TaxID=179676 RepID=A0A336M254_CULSO